MVVVSDKNERITFYILSLTGPLFGLTGITPEGQ